MPRERPDLARGPLHNGTSSPSNTYTKRTLLRSPLICAIYPDFKVSLSKPLAGLSSKSINDENDQTLHEPEEDSYFGDEMSEDDDIVWNLEGNAPQPANALKSVSPIEVDITSVNVLIRHSAIVINGVEFGLNAGVRSSVMIPGPSGTENSLVVSMLSGFVLLIRIWRVPRTYGDASFGETGHAVEESTTSHFFKPFVVQWWKTDAEYAAEVSGSRLSVHSSGLAVVSTAQSSVFRIHMCQQTDMGVQLLPQFNVDVNGIILHSCFSQPLKDVGDDHITFLTLTFSNMRRLDLSLYSWYVSDSPENLVRCTLPLNNSFPVPIMIIPLARNHSFLFVCTDMFIVVTVHNIMSADYSFSRFAYDGSFPTAFHLPEPHLMGPDNQKSDKVLLASDSGTIYAVTVTDNNSLVYEPVAQVADAVSVFTMQKNDSGYMLHYASDTGGSKAIQISTLFTRDIIEADKKLPYSEGVLVQDFKNWSPVIDVLVINSLKVRNIAPYCSQEVWALTGAGKRTKLTHLRSGYSVRKETKPVGNLRKTEEMFRIDLNGRHFIICAMPLSTTLLEYQNWQEGLSEGGNGDSLVEIEASALISDETTLNAVLVPNTSTIVQFTPSRISFTNLEDSKRLDFTNQRILSAKVEHNIAALIIDRELALTLELVELSEITDYESESIHPTSIMRPLCSVSLDFEVSTMSICADAESQKLSIFLGTFEGFINVLEFREAQITEIAQINLSAMNPYASPTSLSNEYVIPHDILYLPQSQQLFVGSELGHLIQFTFTETKLELVQYLLLGYTPVTLKLCKTDHHFLLVCLRNLWLFNFYSSSLPTQVVFEEKTDRPVLRLTELPSTIDQHLRFAFTREDGLVIGSLFCHKVPIVKQISVGESARKVCYLDSMNLFVILTKAKEPLTRLRFVDRKSNRAFPSVEVDSKSGSQRKDKIFEPGEFPVCGFVWEIQRQDRVSKKLIVGTSTDNKSGSVKILDITKLALQGTETPVVRIVELISIPRDEPVTCIEQIGTTIFFSSGCKIFSTSYSFEDRKLRPVRTLTTLSSEVISLSVSDKQNLVVNSRLDSLIVFKYNHGSGEDIDMTDDESDGSLLESLNVEYKDPVSRSLVNHSVMKTKLVAGDKLHSSLIVVDAKDRVSAHPFAYRVSMIPRVYISKFNGLWSKDADVKDRILSVGVNGEVLALEPIDDRSEEINSLTAELEGRRGLPGDSGLDSLVERLNRPFADKVTGKCFQNIYKPYFDFSENCGKLIDYDLEDLSCVQTSSFMI
ncbi:CIC11C00000002568 [Sungouiella intermedia]|uniref:CIC11C00000002568 n=1 Tax=Sungouiella intermedia TaxID=45354 RepID=A0A1L0BW58_9ASCO|nr:CIC11C00000002568 [[Candida] intermedia]